MMTREEMLEKLKQVKFCAAPTVYTMDMGIEYDYITAEGAGTCLGRIGEWPAYRMRGIAEEQWQTIQRKLQDATICEADFAGTDIGVVIESLHSVYGDMYDKYYDNPSETYAGLTELPAILPEYFYCRFDIRAWGEKPDFFADRDEFLEAFRDAYCYDVVPWEEMEDEDLEMWLARTEDDLAEFSMNEFGEDE